MTIDSFCNFIYPKTHIFWYLSLYAEALLLKGSSLNINQTKYDFQSSHTRLPSVGGVIRYEKNTIFMHFWTITAHSPAYIETYTVND